VLDAMNDAVRDDHTRKDFSAIFEKYIHACRARRLARYLRTIASPGSAGVVIGRRRARVICSKL